MKKEDIPHTRNNWICYNFKERRIVPTHYTIRTHDHGTGYGHLKSWLVETSVDGESWQEVAREEDNEKLNGKLLTGTFSVAGEECRFIRLVNIGRTHSGYDRLNCSRSLHFPLSLSYWGLQSSFLSFSLHHPSALSLAQVIKLSHPPIS
jgi:hypothetical protein